MKLYSITFKYAMTADLVMAHASNINHPAYLLDNISRNHILFGIVRKFVYVKWKIGTCNEEHDVIENHKPLNIEWSNLPGDDKNEVVPPLCNHWMKVLSLKNKCALESLNPFLIDAVN